MAGRDISNSHLNVCTNPQVINMECLSYAWKNYRSETPKPMTHTSRWMVFRSLYPDVA